MEYDRSIQPQATVAAKRVLQVDETGSMEELVQDGMTIDDIKTFLIM